MKEANAFIFGLKLAEWPDAKVFDQPQDSELNGLEINYKFEDKASFSALRLRAECVKFEVDLDPQYVNDSEI